MIDVVEVFILFFGLIAHMTVCTSAIIKAIKDGQPPRSGEGSR